MVVRQSSRVRRTAGMPYSRARATTRGKILGCRCRLTWPFRCQGQARLEHHLDLGPQLPLDFRQEPRLKKIAPAYGYRIIAEAPGASTRWGRAAGQNGPPLDQGEMHPQAEAVATPRPGGSRLHLRPRGMRLAHLSSPSRWARATAPFRASGETKIIGVKMTVRVYLREGAGGLQIPRLPSNSPPNPL